MPLKLPKGFNRRKSSGNALEEVQNPPEPSFHVFERPQTGSKSFDGGNTFKRTSLGRPLSAGLQLENSYDAGGRPHLNPTLSNRGSGGTNTSSSSGELYDYSSPSARYSSSSTLPSSSSIDAIPDDYAHAHPKPLQDKHNPPVAASQSPFSLRAAGKTFSFARKPAPQSSSPASASQQDSRSTASPLNEQGIRNITRQRALTESSHASTSTATPPKLLDTDLNFGNSDEHDGFGDMFEDFVNRKGRILDEQEDQEGRTRDSPERMSPTLATVPGNAYFNKRLLFTTPPPLVVDRSQEVVRSPYSCDSQDSRDGLISSFSPEDSRRHDKNDNPPVPPHQNGILSSTPEQFTADSSTSRAKAEVPGFGFGSALRRSSAYESQRNSTPLQKEDATLAVDYINASRMINRQSVTFESTPRSAERTWNEEKLVRPSMAQTKSFDPVTRGANVSNVALDDNAQARQHSPIALVDGHDPDVASNSRWRLKSTDTTPRANNPVLANQDEPLLFNDSYRETAISARYNEAKTAGVRDKLPAKPAPQSKVMTPAQFERYRTEQELSRKMSIGSNSKASDEDGDTYEDDDETERNRQLLKQRRKQQADLAVYRQQMMKVTGEQPSDLPNLGLLRPGTDRSHGSTLNLSTKSAENGKGSDDEDEDIPLGILAAHGFPTKNRPPAHLAQRGSTPNIRYTSETYPPPPASIAGESTVDRGRGSLPPFARNLPQDPYFGASLVNPSNRESLAFGNGSKSSAFNGSAPNVHPGGLVGVIAGEERAKAIRRGSPNAQGGYNDPNLPFGGMPLMHPSMSQMSMPPGVPPISMMSPNDQAQFQMSQQMTQMMQMQMQWMQQMMQMQGLQPGQQAQVPFPPQPPPQPVTNNGFLAPQTPQLQRPVSMGSRSAPVTPGVQPHIQHRSMSMLDSVIGSQVPFRGSRQSLAPSMMSGALGPPKGYAPSITPSERSNIGQPSRYRPVSIAPIEEAPRNITSRASTLSPNTPLQGWGDRKGVGQASVKVIIGDPTKSDKKGKGASDEDEEEGWEEMKTKRDQQMRERRARRRDTSGISDLYYPGT